MNLVLPNIVLKSLGFLFLVLARIQNQLLGYRRARPYGVSDIDRTVAHSIQVVDDWVDAYAQYTGHQPSLAGKRVLELGPGPDLCTAVILLSKGIRSYASLDAFPLALSTPEKMYQSLFDALQLDPIGRQSLEDEVKQTLAGGVCHELRGSDSRIHYTVRSDFDLRKAFPEESFDLFLSSAAFEHFDNVERTLRQITELSREGSQLVFSIDFKTHSRWIRDLDPLSIYRFSDALYGALSFKGSPNRVALPRYIEILESMGWRDIRTFHVYTVSDSYFAKVRDSLSPSFRNDNTRYLWAILCASRG